MHVPTVVEHIGPKLTFVDNELVKIFNNVVDHVGRVPKAVSYYSPARGRTHLAVLAQVWSTTLFRLERQSFFPLSQG